ncbi:MAG: VWA domain-containing protein [Burkholderiales bacterium]
MLEAFHFIRPLWLLALLALWLLAWRLARSGTGDNPWQRAVDAALLPLLMAGGAGAARPGMLRLVAAGWTIAAVALAGPTWQRKPEPVYQTSAARVVVLDLSTSMHATDLKPSRLERARFKVEDVLALGQEGQTGLVVYAGDAFAVAPLTRDVNTLKAMLKVLSPELMPVQGSRADLGLLKAEALMQQAGVSSGQVLLIADGVDPDHRGAATDAAAKLRKDGYRVSVLGVGTEQGAPMADAGGHLLRDASGKLEMTRRDLGAIEAVARAGGGRVLPMSDNGDALRAMLEPDAHARVDTGRGKLGATASAWVDKGPWLVLLLLPLAALAFRRNVLIDDSPAAASRKSHQARKAQPGRTSAALAVGGAMVLGGWLSPTTPAHASTWDNAWRRPDQQAAAAMATGDYAKAAQLATDAELRGSAEYKRGDYATALKDFSSASGPRADYNRGNALAQLGKYAEAVAAYDKTLGADPHNADAKANKAAVEALLRKQQQQDQAQKSKPQDGQQQDKESKQSQQGQQGQQGQPGQQEQQEPHKQQGQQGQQQASNAKGDSSADKSGQSATQRPTPGESGAPSGAPSSQAGESAASPASAAQNRQAQASPAQLSAAPRQAGGEQQQDAAAGQAQQQAAPKPGESFAEAARKVGAQGGAPKPTDDATPPGAVSPATAQSVPAPGAKPEAGGAVPGAQPIPSEEQLAAEQWLRRIPDDPGGLLRRKFLYQYQQRERDGARAGGG